MSEFEKIARIFPRKTTASPTDELAFFSSPGFFIPEIKEVHVSVLFTYDLPIAEKLAKEWERIAPVKIGGPALGDSGDEFIPGKYIKKGFVVTSRGCPNHCWFCKVWKNEGQKMRELPVCEGYNLLDSNLLACSETHISKVFEMLSRQKTPIEFSGGLEAAKFKPWHAEKISKLRLSQIFFAYDTPDDLDPLVEAGKLLRSAGIGFKKSRCYVLIGYRGDTFEHAEKRLMQTVKAGFLPMAMLYRDAEGTCLKEWRRFQKTWCRPAATMTLLKSNPEYCKKLSAPRLAAAERGQTVEQFKAGQLTIDDMLQGDE
jgi:hypothetical protein